MNLAIKYLESCVVQVTNKIQFCEQQLNDYNHESKVKQEEIESYKKELNEVSRALQLLKDNL